ncbi:MAG: CHAT domain-containing tetratricopeptide repeat protein [Pseudomonadota bacterium]
MAVALLMPLMISCCEFTKSSDEDTQAATGTIAAETVGQQSDPDRLTRLNEETAEAYDNELYVKALRLGEEAYELGLETLGERHPKTLFAAYQLARIYRYVDRDDQAEALYQKTLDLRREVLGERDPETLKTLHGLADFYKDRGRFSEALPLFEETLRIVREDFGERNEVTRIAMDSLADTYRKLGREIDARPIYHRLVETRRAVLGDRHKRTRDSIDDLAWTLKELGEYQAAEALFEELLAIERKDLGPRHADTLSTLTGLATVYWNQGRNGEAEPIYQDVLAARRSILGETDIDTLLSMHNLAILYHSQGLYDQAEELYENILELQEKHLGKRHPDTLLTLDNLGIILRAQGRFQEAEPITKTALERRRDVFGDRHPETLTSLNNLGVIYQRRGRYGQAGDIYEEVLKRRKEVLGERHPETLTSLHNLAYIYVRHTRYADAYPLYERAYKLRRELIGPRHPDTLASEFGSVYALMYTGRIDDAVKTLKATADDRLAYAEAELATNRSANVRNMLLNSQGHFQDYVLSMALRYKRPDTLALAGDVMLHWKQVQGAEAAFVAQLLRTESEPSIRALGQQILNLRTRLARVSQEETPTENPVKVLEELEAKELALARVSGAFKRRQGVRRASIDSLQAVLPDNAGVVEFRQFVPVNSEGGKLGGARFAALLVRPGRAPILTNAGEVEDAERLLAIIRNEIVPARAQKAAVELKKQLFSAFGEDLDSLDKVYVAPDGILNLVPFDRLQLADGSYWNDHQELRILQAGRELLEKLEPSEPGQGLLALGGIDFGSAERPVADAPSVDTGNSSEQQVIAAIDPALLGDVRARVRGEVEVFSPLAGSLLEVAHIERLFKEQSPKAPVTVWTGAAASESGLKSLGRQVSPPRILHIATHGFYLATPDRQLRSQLNSGIALAGANHGLGGGDVQGEDGILFSLEAESLNLEGTELVVLSACDTGRGVIDYSEGVVGMVRALRIAGARRVLMTLWPISDQATAEFMRSFYDHWLNAPEDGPAAALKAAKASFRVHPDERYRKPRIWAPFVLIGA